MDGINIYIVLINNFAKHLYGFVNGDYEVTPHRLHITYSINLHKYNKPYKKINIDPYIKVVSHFYGHVEIDKRSV